MCARLSSIRPVLVSLLSLLPALLLAQQLPPRLPASPSPPPEFQRAQEAQARVEQIQKERGALPASPTAPPQQRAEDRLPQPAPSEAAAQRAPTRDELLQKLRELPGGAQRLEEARRRGAPIPQEASAARLLRGALQVLAWLNPLRVESAEAQVGAQVGFSVSLTPTSAYSSSPFARVDFYGVDVYGGSPDRRYLNTLPLGTVNPNPTTPPWAMFAFTVPANGWYVISFSGTAYNSRAGLFHFGTAGWQSIATWDYSTQYANLSFPALVELAAGTHFFAFKPTAGFIVPMNVQAFAVP